MATYPRTIVIPGPGGSGKGKSVLVPDPSYPVNSQFNGTYDGSKECAGFARYIFNKWFGFDGNEGKTITLGSKDDVKNAFANIHIGARIRGGGTHSMILIEKTASGIDVYHANWPNNNIVAISTFKWEDFYSRYKSVLFHTV